MSWDRIVQAIATAQDVSEILITHTCNEWPEEQLFRAKNSFMYSVFVTILDTAKSRKHVRKYQKDMDAQALYASLKTEYETGTAADMAIEATQSELVSMKLNDSWNKPYESFLDVWDHKVLDLENMLDSNISGTEKRNWLTSAIRCNDDLYAAVSMHRLWNTQLLASTTETASCHMSSSTTWSELGIILDANRKERPVVRANQTQCDQPKDKYKRPEWFLPKNSGEQCPQKSVMHFTSSVIRNKGNHKAKSEAKSDHHLMTPIHLLNNHLTTNLGMPLNVSCLMNPQANSQCCS